jgi:hypothetical protein
MCSATISFLPDSRRNRFKFRDGFTVRHFHEEQRKGTHKAATFLHSSVIPPGPTLRRATFGYEYNGTQHNRGAGRRSIVGSDPAYNSGGPHSDSLLETGQPDR